MTDKDNLPAEGQTPEDIVKGIYEGLPQIPLSERSDDWLHQRYYLGTTLIGLVQQEDDPRVPEAVERLRSQQQKILDEILSRGLPPPAQTVKMKAIEWNVTAPAVNQE